MIEFVEFDRSFLKFSWDWLNDEEIRNLTNTSPITKIQQENWFASLSSLSDYYIWGIKCDNVSIGACGLKRVTNVDAEWWGYIGDKEYWGKGIGKQILFFIEKKALELMLSCVYLRVNKDNHRCINLHSNKGYIVIHDDGKILIMKKQL